jgi:hypothetical protein
MRAADDLGPDSVRRPPAKKVRTDWEFVEATLLTESRNYQGLVSRGREFLEMRPFSIDIQSHKGGLDRFLTPGGVAVRGVAVSKVPRLTCTGVPPQWYSACSAGSSAGLPESGAKPLSRLLPEELIHLGIDTPGSGIGSTRSPISSSFHADVGYPCYLSNLR